MGFYLSFAKINWLFTLGSVTNMLVLFDLRVWHDEGGVMCVL